MFRFLTFSGLPVYRHAPDAIWETSLMEWGTRAAFQQSPSAWWQGFLDRGYVRLFIDVNERARQRESESESESRVWETALQILMLTYAEF